jgi:hypothetical protein
MTATVSMREHRPRYATARWPWCHIGNMGDLWEQRLLSRVQYDDQGPKALYIKDAGGLICRPTVDLTTRTEQWRVFPEADVTLETEKDSLLGTESGQTFAAYWGRQRKQKTDAGAYVVSAWFSAWEACANPFLFVGLKRQALPDDYSSAIEPYTEIGFGITDDAGIRIRLPYRRDSFPVLYDQNGWNGAAWYPQEWSTGGLSFSEGEEGVQTCLFVVGFVAGRMYIWKPGSSTPIASYARNVAGREEWLYCKEANIGLTHTVGELSVAVRPMILSPVQLMGPQIFTGTDDFTGLGQGIAPYGYCMTADGYTVPTTDAILDFGFTNTYGSLQWVNAPLAGMVKAGRVGAGDVAETLLPAQHTTWFAELVPLTRTHSFTYSGTAYSVTTYSTPLLAAVDLWQPAELTDNGAPAESEDLSAAKKVHAIEVDEPEGWSTSQCRFTFHNRRHEDDWAASIGLLRQFDVTANWRSEYDYPDSGWVDDTAYQLGTFWGFDPDYDTRYCTINALDAMGLLALYRVADELSPGDGQDVTAQIAEWLQAARIGTALQDLEDAGFTFENSPQLKERLWLPRRGVSLAAFLQEVQEKAAKGGAIWCETGIIKTGCKYCGQKRTSADWAQHQDSGWGSSACLAADIVRAGATGLDAYLIGSGNERAGLTAGPLVLEATVRKVSETLLGRFANYVDVSGEDSYGRPVRSVVWDYDSINTPAAANYAGGFVIPHIETSSAHRSFAGANLRANQVLNDKSELPTWIEATFLCEPSLSRGCVVGVKGWDNLGIDGKRYRVTQLSPPIVRDGVPWQKLRAREIGAI